MVKTINFPLFFRFTRLSYKLALELPTYIACKARQIRLIFNYFTDQSNHVRNDQTWRFFRVLPKEDQVIQTGYG